jgi:hypothetical protein
MMRDMMSGPMGSMMTGMGTLWVLIVVALILGVVTMVKYLFARK